MKIGIVAPSSVPFTLGGAERFWNGLVQAFNERTPHDAELIKLPSPEHNLPDLVSSYRTFSRLDVRHFDMVVTSKYPAWMLAHENHVVYMLHTLRGLYDTYPSHLPRRETNTPPALRSLTRLLDRAPERALLDDAFEAFDDALAAVGRDDPSFAFPGPLAYRLVHWLDGVGLDPAAVRRYFAISRTVAQRAEYFPTGASVAPLYPPTNLTGLREGPFEAFFTASRLDRPKRIELLVQAMRHVPRAVPLLIAGTGPESARLHELAAGDPRIRFLGYVPDDQLTDYYANALAVPFVPLDEDLGLITLEAMLSGKPVITTTDAGGPTEFVADGVNGLIARPDPASLGAAMAALATKPARARALGNAARRTAEKVTWQAVVDALVDGPSGSTAPGAATAPVPRRGSPRVVVLSTFPVWPRRGGGQLRCFHLYRGLAERYDVEVVSLTGPAEALTEREVAAGFYETSVPKSEEHEHREIALHRAVDTPVTDIAASMLIQWSPAYLGALERALAGAQAVVLAHPFLLPALDLVGADRVPVVYDAHNAEYALKRSILPDNAVGRELAGAARAVEEAALRRSVFSVVCAQEDAVAFASEFGIGADSLLELPNGADTTAVPFVSPSDRAAASAQWRARWSALSGFPEGRGLAMFVGSWHPPNIDAALHIIEMAPLVPDVTFALLGGHCLAFEGWRLPSNVVLMGEVSSVMKEAMLGSADIALNPITRGSGTNLKIVEYFAAGAPVVSTPLGARGLEVSAGEHLSVAPLEGFPAAVSALLDEPERAAAMATAARSLVERRYDWGVLGARLLAEMERVLEAPALR